MQCVGGAPAAAPDAAPAPTAATVAYSRTWLRGDATAAWRSRGRRQGSDCGGGEVAVGAAMVLSLLVPPMKLRRCRVSILLLAAAATQQPPPASALDNGLGVTPPMGWRSW
jgi:hypothetical protein